MTRAVIQRALPGDCTRLSALAFRSKAHWGYDAAFMEACRDELTLTPAFLSDHPTYLRLFDATTVGFYSLEVLSRDQIELGHLFVEPAAIGRGHGRALLDHAISATRAGGHRALVIQGDPHAAAFYARCGARHIGDRASDSIPGRMLPCFEISLEPREL